MPERWGARAVMGFSRLPLADNPALPKQAPGAAAAESRPRSFPGGATRAGETRLGAALEPGLAPAAGRAGSDGMGPIGRAGTRCRAGTGTPKGKEGRKGDN